MFVRPSPVTPLPTVRDLHAAAHELARTIGPQQGDSDVGEDLFPF